MKTITLRLILFIFFLGSGATFPLQSFGIIRDYQTTRMISTSGAGVASILMVDALFLNPATSAYFKENLIYAQHNNGKLKARSSTRPSNDQYPNDPGGFTLAATDSSSPIRGGFAYVNYDENDRTRERYSLNMSQAVSAGGAFGITHYYTIDKPIGLNKDAFHRTNLGIAFIQNERFSMGAVVNDIAQGQSEASTAIAGVQYLLSKNTVVMLDSGFNYRGSLSDSIFYRSAIQIKFLERVLVRAGIFNDKHFNTKGGSWGVSWVGPRFTIEFANLVTKRRDDLSVYLYENEAINEASFSFVLKL
ncbi:MAG: hypothetical protein H6621_06985 [Halobacteriovoraceae bacterium]|nr:hypothetical protein [Halobacteriovoraceae bacterium]